MARGREEELVDRYERWMRSVDRSPNTIKARLRMANLVVKEFPDLNAIDTTELSDWFGTLGERTDDLARWSRATYYSGIRAFFKWLELSRLIDADPTASPLFERPKPRKGVPKPLSAAETSRLLETARGNTLAWVLMALLAGLRAAEIAAFRGENITEERIILIGKGSKEASIPTHPDLWALAERYPRRGWWFPSPAHDGHVAGGSVTIMIGRLFRSLDMDGSIHRCRHTFATNLLRRGANLRQVQELMRHESPATTAVYTAVDEDELRARINLLGGVA